MLERGRTVLDAGCGDGLPVDAFLIEQGFAVNGIDASALLIDRARKNVPEGFYEVRELTGLVEGEYCVDGVVSLHAMLRMPRRHNRTLLTNFASYMPNGGALLLAMRPFSLGQAGEDDATAAEREHDDEALENTELLERAGFTVVSHELERACNDVHAIILARS